MLEQEAINVVKNYDLAVDYKDAILFVMEYVEANTYILNCAYNSMGREEMKRFFYADFVDITQNIICNIEQELNIHVSDHFKNILCDLYTEAIAGLLINCFKCKEKINKVRMLNYVSLMIYTGLPAILKEAANQSL